MKNWKLLWTYLYSEGSEKWEGEGERETKRDSIISWHLYAYSENSHQKKKAIKEYKNRIGIVIIHCYSAMHSNT